MLSSHSIEVTSTKARSITVSTFTSPAVFTDYLTNSYGPVHLKFFILLIDSLAISLWSTSDKFFLSLKNIGSKPFYDIWKLFSYIHLVLTKHPYHSVRWISPRRLNLAIMTLFIEINLFSISSPLRFSVKFYKFYYQNFNAHCFSHYNGSSELGDSKKVELVSIF